MRLTELGETKTIELIRKIIESQYRSASIKVGIGDDACVFKNGTIITTDAYLEDIHFSLDYFTLREVGERAVCGTLSDIAAMAGIPIAIFISTLLPKTLKKTDLQELYQGMQNITNRFKCEIAGGDIVAYPKLGLILTAVGKTKHAKLRSTAKPGEYLYVSGYCGLAETGRLVLANKLSKRDFPQSIKRHHCPIPRINEALKLNKFINALIDTSDGLSTDAFHISKESKVKITIFYEKLPIHIETTKLYSYINKNTIDNVVLNGGEDYELLFTSDRPNLPLSIRGTKITQIGIIEPGQGVFIIKAGKEYPLKPAGYNHLTSDSNK
ncbi:MAG: thiamine-phosphate kinase [candidate division WOR-3 bacterium]